MNKLLTLSIFCLIIIGLAFNTQAQNLSSQQTETIKKEVDAIFMKMIGLAEKLQFDGLKAGIDDKYKAGFISNNKYYPEFAPLLEDVKIGGQGVREQRVAIAEKKISVLSDRIALLTATGTSYVSLNDGREFSPGFFWTFVYEKIDNEWKVVQSHQSQLRQ